MCIGNKTFCDLCEQQQHHNRKAGHKSHSCSEEDKLCKSTEHGITDATPLVEIVCSNHHHRGFTFFSFFSVHTYDVDDTGLDVVALFCSVSSYYKCHRKY